MVPASLAPNAALQHCRRFKLCGSGAQPPSPSCRFWHYPLALQQPFELPSRAVTVLSLLPQGPPPAAGLASAPSAARRFRGPDTMLLLSGLPPPSASEASESLRTSALRSSKPSACVLLPQLAHGEALACSHCTGMSASPPCRDLLTAGPHRNASSASCSRQLSVPDLCRVLLVSLLPPA